MRRSPSFLAALGLALALSCGHRATPPVTGAVVAAARAPTVDLDPGPGSAIASAALHFLQHPTSGFRNDCSGFVEATLHRAGVTHLVGSTKQMWSASLADGSVHHLRQPTVGDLVFFDNTYDRNRNGKTDDLLTHIAVVIEVEPGGTVLMAHDGTSSGRSTLRMNLHHPHRTRMGEQRLNDRLRWPDPSQPERPTLTGQLWRGFATVRGDAVAMGTE